MEVVRLDKYEDNGKVIYGAYYNGGIGVPNLTAEEEKKVAEVFEMIVSKYKE